MVETPGLRTAIALLGSACALTIHVDWTGFEEQETLRRTPKRGGPTESLWSVPIRWIQAVAVDACNVYWVAANPYEVFFRAK